MAYTSKLTLVTGHIFKNKDFYLTDEYFELIRLWNRLYKDPVFDLAMEVMRENPEAIRLWELLTKANNIQVDKSEDSQVIRKEVEQMKQAMHASDVSEGKTLNRKLKVFLCHSSHDKLAVRELYEHLNAEGWIDPWLDEENLLPGQDWDMEIEKAVEHTDAVLVFLSNNSINKEGYVQKEIKKVLDISDEKPEGTIFIIPLRLEECEPPRRLRKWQYVDYFPFAKKGRAYTKIATSLGLRADKSGVLRSAKPKQQLVRRGPKEYAVHGMFFVKVDKGSFFSGKKREDGNYEKQQDISYDYWIGSYPVSNEQYAQFLKETSYYFPFIVADGAHPVSNVTWNDAQAYVDWLNKAPVDTPEIPSGYEFQLPLALEWEKAARGIDGRLYPWGDEFDKNKCNTRESGIGHTTLLGRYSPQGDSPYSAKDMAGNVWEWTKSAVGDVFSPRVLLCGGSFADDPKYAQCAFTAYYPSATRTESFGFRVVIVPSVAVS